MDSRVRGGTTLEPAPTQVDRSARRSTDAPGRFVPFVWLVLSVVLGWITAGLILAMVGSFRLTLLIPLWIALSAGLWWLSRDARRAADPVTGRWTTRIRMLAIVIAAGAASVNVMFPGEHFLTGRDGGTYTATAGWIASDGGLLIESRVAPFDRGTDLAYDAAGFHPTNDPGVLYPQFLHAFPVTMATAKLVGGVDAMVRVNPLLGGVALLVLYAFAERFMRPAAALVAQLGLALNLVFVYFTRAPFSEVLTLIMVFGGLWALDQATRLRSSRTGLAAGLLLGAVFVARLDGLVALLMLAAALLPPIAGREVRAVAPALGWGLLGTMTLAWLDLALFSPVYVVRHVDFLWPIGAAFIGLLMVSALTLLPGSRRVLRAVLLRRSLLAGGLAVLIVLAAAYATFVRPQFEVANWDRTTPIGWLQAAEGQPVDEARTYAELSMHWLSWYVGPVALAAGVLGWAALTWRTVRWRVSRVVPFVLIFSGLTILYVWRPTITPDHIWAARRFLPVVIPGLLVIAAWLADQIWDRGVDLWSRAGTRAVSLVIAAALVLSPLPALAPVATLRETAGLAESFEQACARLGSDAAAVVLAEPDAGIHWRITVPLRGLCGIPTAWMQAPVDPERLAELRDQNDGGPLYILASDPDNLPETVTGPAFTLIDLDYDLLEQTLTKPPSEIGRYGLQVVAAEVE